MSDTNGSGKYAAQARYNDRTRRRIPLNLNINTDQDILEHLSEVDNVQGYIKHLIRSDMASQHKSRINPA